ncbi:RHS repeat-associated core domain-containing protein [Burkholderia ubonensis]|uniref:RHS repeat-associated core domain-containing protein n=1 Tax=Burkholderia ubonensis TaxID=101571 RepID=UPI0009B3C7B6|nr:RHS repeat-associated core domain-containing protein [Burkholderia ubonensis]
MKKQTSRIARSGTDTRTLVSADESRLVSATTGSPGFEVVNDVYLPIGFNGYLLDSATGCYVLGNGYRLYNPVMRAFYSPDSESPFGDGGVNRYQYCYLDPINRTDPTGHASGWAIGGMILGVLGIALGILLAIPTGGASLSLAAVAAGVVAGGLGVAAIGTGIASLAYQSSDPTYADRLGKISFGLGGLSVAVASIAAPFAPVTASLAAGNKLLIGMGGLTQLGGSATVIGGAATGNEKVTTAGAIIFGVGLAISALGATAPVMARVAPQTARSLLGPQRAVIRRGVGGTARAALHNAATGTRYQPAGLGDVLAGVYSRMPYPRLGV